jgi:hypothetical protein
MKTSASTFVFSVLVCLGCSSSRPHPELYQSHITNVADASITLRCLDRGEISRAHEHATMQLTSQLEHLHSLSKVATKDELETAANLAHLILVNANEHKEQLLRDKYSLQMVIACKSLVTNTQDTDQASELAQYLTTTSTNQIVYPNP